MIGSTDAAGCFASSMKSHRGAVVRSVGCG